MKLGTGRHHKVRHLTRLLDISRAQAIGHLNLMWELTMGEAPQGDIGKIPDQDIEDDCDWSGESGALVAAMLEVGWLCHDAEYRLLVHDWDDHCPEFIKKRLRRGSHGIHSCCRTVTERSPNGHRTADNGDRVDAERSPRGHRAAPDVGGVGCLGREGHGREGHGMEGDKAPLSPPAPEKRSENSPELLSLSEPLTPEQRARAVWPRLVRLAAEYGVSWSERPGKAQIALVASRLRSGDLDERGLVNVIRGYVALRGTTVNGDFNPLAHLHAKTLYAASNWPDYLQAGRSPPPRKAARSMQPKPSSNFDAIARGIMPE